MDIIIFKMSVDVFKPVRTGLAVTISKDQQIPFCRFSASITATGGTAVFLQPDIITVKRTDYCRGVIG